MCSVYWSAMLGFSMSRMMTDRPLQYRKVLPFGSPPSCTAEPRAVAGCAASTLAAHPQRRRLHASESRPCVSASMVPVPKATTLVACIPRVYDMVADV